jgi:cytochrome c-type biogenesis protein CcmH/NrfF
MERGSLKMTGWFWKAALSLSVFLIFSGALVVSAQAQQRSDDEVSRITREVAQEVYSPYCPGQTLAMCPSANASYARQDIQEMARQGMSSEEIKREMLDRYGEKYELVEPSSQDHLWLVGSIVTGLFLAILAVAVLAKRRLVDGSDEDDEQRGGPDGADGDLDDDDPLLADLRAEYRD